MFLTEEGFGIDLVLVFRTRWAPGNGAAIGGLKVTTQNAWFEGKNVYLPH